MGRKHDAFSLHEVRGPVDFHLPRTHLSSWRNSTRVAVSPRTNHDDSDFARDLGSSERARSREPARGRRDVRHPPDSDRRAHGHRDVREDPSAGSSSIRARPTTSHRPARRTPWPGSRSRRRSRSPRSLRSATSRRRRRSTTPRVTSIGIVRTFPVSSLGNVWGRYEVRTASVADVTIAARQDRRRARSGSSTPSA